MVGLEITMDRALTRDVSSRLVVWDLGQAILRSPERDEVINEERLVVREINKTR